MFKVAISVIFSRKRMLIVSEAGGCFVFFEFLGMTGAVKILYFLAMCLSKVDYKLIVTLFLIWRS